MQTNPIMRKELVCGIVVLFLGMSIVPLAGSLPIEKEQSKMTKGCSVDLAYPYVKITSPESGFLYISFADLIFIKIPFYSTVIIRTINVTVNATDNQSGVGVNRVEFYVDDKLQYSDKTFPYYWIWSWPGHFHLYRLRVIAFDNAGNQNSDELWVWKIF